MAQDPRNQTKEPTTSGQNETADDQEAEEEVPKGKKRSAEGNLAECEMYSSVRDGSNAAVVHSAQIARRFRRQ